MTVFTKDTQAQSLDEVGLKTRQTQAQQIVDLVVSAMKYGCKDLSLTELQHAWERKHGRRIDKSTISARVHNLVLAGRLYRCHDIRLCSLTKKPIHAVYAPYKQASLSM